MEAFVGVAYAIVEEVKFKTRPDVVELRVEFLGFTTGEHIVEIGAVAAEGSHREVGFHRHAVVENISEHGTAGNTGVLEEIAFVAVAKIAAHAKCRTNLAAVFLRPCGDAEGDEQC